MRKILSLFYATLFLSSLSFAETPSWLKNPEKDYPQAKYLRALGIADSQKKARESALSELSLYLNAKVDVATHVIKESKSYAESDKTIFKDSTSFKQITNISSEAELFCVDFTECHYDNKNKTYSVLAYLNKREAVEVYNQRINTLMDSITSYQKYASGEKEIFLAVGALQKASMLSELVKAYAQTVGTIFPSENSKYSSQLEIINRINENLISYKKNLSFSLSYTDERCRSIADAISSIFEENGYVYSEKGGAYTVYLDFAFEEEQYAVGPFVRPSGKIEIKNSAGEPVYSYSKAYKRAGAKTVDSAYTRAIFKIKNDLKENFLKEYRELPKK